MPVGNKCITFSCKLFAQNVLLGTGQIRFTLPECEYFYRLSFLTRCWRTRLTPFIGLRIVWRNGVNSVQSGEKKGIGLFRGGFTRITFSHIRLKLTGCESKGILTSNFNSFVVPSCKSPGENRLIQSGKGGTSFSVQSLLEKRQKTKKRYSAKADQTIK